MALHNQTEATADLFCLEFAGKPQFFEVYISSKRLQHQCFSARTVDVDLLSNYVNHPDADAPPPAEAIEASQTLCRAWRVFLKKESKDLL